MIAGAMPSAEMLGPKTMVSRRLSQTADWEDNFALLQKHMEEHGAIDHTIQEFWLVTSNTQLNEWLVYNKIELRRPHRQQDQRWQERRQRLEQLGFTF
jgi:hypothetical protein